VAVTAAAGVTTTRRADPDAPGGVRVVAAELPPPAAGSVEAALGGGAVADLAARRGRPAPDRIRVLDAFQPVPVAEAYDLVAVLPRISPSDTGDG
jgi:erythromycin esterase